MGQQSRGFTPFQKKANQILIRHGWTFKRFTGTKHAMYVKPGHPIQIVSGTPSNPDKMLKVIHRICEKGQ